MASFFLRTGTLLTLAGALYGCIQPLDVGSQSTGGAGGTSQTGGSGDTGGVTETQGWSIPFDQGLTDTRLTASAIGPDHSLYLAGVRHGDTAGTVFLVRVSPAGDIVWSREYDTHEAQIDGLGVDAAGEILVSGSIFHYVDFGHGPHNNPWVDQNHLTLFAGKLDATGTEMWLHAYDGGTLSEQLLASNAAGESVVWILALDNLEIGGVPINPALDTMSCFAVKLGSDGEVIDVIEQNVGTMTPATLKPLSITMNDSGAFVVAGLYAGFLNVGSDEVFHADVTVGDISTAGTFVVSYGADGQVLWVKGPDDLTVSRMTRTSDGDVVLLGDLHGNVDLGGGTLPMSGLEERSFLARFDASGAHVHSVAFDTGHKLRIDSFNAGSDGVASFDVYYQAGEDLTALGGVAVDDSFYGHTIARLDENDTFQEVLDWRSSVDEVPSPVIRTREDGIGGIYAYGTYHHPDFDLGFGPLPNGSPGLFVARLLP